jgi:4-amino-4-deoxy-L-arabinose transferase-like glycosyltransferase
MDDMPAPRTGAGPAAAAGRRRRRGGRTVFTGRGRLNAGTIVAAVANARAEILLLAMVCVLTFFAGLGATALWEPDEPRFAEATRQMLARHDFVTPWFNDGPRFEKPVLLYWLQLPFFAALGATEAAARSPAALAGLLTVLAIFALGRDLVSTRAGVFAGLILATTFRFVVYARQGLTDVPVVAAVSCGVWAMSRALRDPAGGGRLFAYVGWAYAALGVLLKGPVGLLAPVVWTLWAAASGGREALRRTRPLAGLIVLILIAGPWYLVMLYMHGGAFVETAVGYEILARYFSDDFPGRDRGVLYYWGVWLGDGLPCRCSFRSRAGGPGGTAFYSATANRAPSFSPRSGSSPS